MKTSDLIFVMGILILPLVGWAQDLDSMLNDSSNTLYFQKRADLYQSRANKLEESGDIDKKIVIALYKQEAQYRHKAIEVANPVTISLYKDLAMALYRSEDFIAAEKVLNTIQKRNENYIQPIRCFTSDKEPNNWSVLPLAEEIFKNFGGQAADLTPGQLQTLLVAMEALALKAFDPVGNNDQKDYDCAAAQAYIAKINAINAGYINSRAGLKSVSEYCAQQ